MVGVSSEKLEYPQRMTRLDQNSLISIFSHNLFLCIFHSSSVTPLVTGWSHGNLLKTSIFAEVCWTLCPAEKMVIKMIKNYEKGSKYLFLPKFVDRVPCLCFIVYCACVLWEGQQSNKGKVTKAKLKKQELYTLTDIHLFTLLQLLYWWVCSIYIY